MYHYEQFSGMQSQYKSFVLFARYRNRFTHATIRILSLLKTECGQVHLMICDHEGDLSIWNNE